MRLSIAFMTIFSKKMKKRIRRIVLALKVNASVKRQLEKKSKRMKTKILSERKKIHSLLQLEKRRLLFSFH